MNLNSPSTYILSSVYPLQLPTKTPRKELSQADIRE